jgi:DNA processing protein
MTVPVLDRVRGCRAVGDLTSDANDDTVARMVWSSIVEPGDRIAGALIDVYGPADALAFAETATDRATDIERARVTLTDCGHPTTEDELREALARWTARLEEAHVVAQLEVAARMGARVVIPGDDAWPLGLSELGNHAPHALWLRGNCATLERAGRAIAIVGARASTGYGEHVTMELVSGLVRKQFVIVSGAAYGIDGMAHRAALAEEGDTIAVLAGGIDRLYPSGHDALLHRIIATGAVITEMPPGFSPTKWRFLQRNRLIAAMCRATVVVEAGWRSGSLNTAHHAVELGRPLGVVPGPVTSASSAGCHRLLREEPCTCVTTADEVAELVDGIEATRAGTATSVSANEQRALDALSTKPRAIDDLMIASGMSRAEVESALGPLALRGLAEETPAGWRSPRTAGRARR